MKKKGLVGFSNINYIGPKWKVLRGHIYLFIYLLSSSLVGQVGLSEV